MATVTYNSLEISDSKAKGIGAFFSNLLKSIEDAQMRKAQAYVDEYLKTLSESQLAELQFGEQEIKAIKSGESLSNIRKF